MSSYFVKMAEARSMDRGMPRQFLSPMPGGNQHDFIPHYAKGINKGPGGGEGRVRYYCLSVLFSSQIINYAMMNLIVVFWMTNLVKHSNFFLSIICLFMSSLHFCYRIDDLVKYAVMNWIVVSFMTNLVKHSNFFLSIYMLFTLINVKIFHVHWICHLLYTYKISTVIT